MIIKNDVAKSNSGRGSTSVNNPGANIDTIKLTSSKYVTTPEMEPRNLPTTTTEAVAVGQIKASIAPSHKTFKPSFLTDIASNEQAMKNNACSHKTLKCHLCGRSSLGLTRRNERKIIKNSKTG